MRGEKPLRARVLGSGVRTDALRCGCLSGQVLELRVFIGQGFNLEVSLKRHIMKSKILRSVISQGRPAR